MKKGQDRKGASGLGDVSLRRSFMMGSTGIGKTSAIAKDALVAHQAGPAFLEVDASDLVAVEAALKSGQPALIHLGQKSEKPGGIDAKSRPKQP